MCGIASEANLACLEFSKSPLSTVWKKHGFVTSFSDVAFQVSAHAFQVVVGGADKDSRFSHSGRLSVADSFATEEVWQRKIRD